MRTVLRCCEILLMIFGVILLAVYAFFRIHGWFFQTYDSWSFDRVLNERQQQENDSRLPEESRSLRDLEVGPEVTDYRDWAPERAMAHERSLKRRLQGTVGRLLIPSLKLNVMVLEGTDPWTLNRAVGHIERTALPGGTGNVGISAHRDGFFRNLGRISKGDEISLVTTEKTYTYAVESTQIVNPRDVEVLAPSDRPVLTLVTCFPFYFVGDAPQRFIVKAELVD